MEEAKYPDLHIWHDSIMKTKKYRPILVPQRLGILKDPSPRTSLHPSLFLEVSEGEAEAGLAATLTWHKTD